MKFEPKISGTRVDDFGKINVLFHEQMVLLSEAMKTIQKQETMDFLLDTFRFSKCGENYPGEWVTILDYDTIYKITILDRDEYSEQRKELEDYFGAGWLKQYIRFSH